MEALVIALLAASFLAALVLTPLAGRVARSAGIVDRAEHSGSAGDGGPGAEPVGLLGGAAIFVSLAAVAGGLVVWLASAGGGGGGGAPEVREAARQLAAESGHLRFGAIAAGAVIVFLVGLADDRWGLSPRVRILVEVLVAVGLVAAGVRMTALVRWQWVGAIVTVLWIVGITNAFNLLDNMDGLSAGVAAVAALAFFVVMVQTEQWMLALLFVTVAGAAGGFLMHNLHPARVYMGDSGALLLGYLLASLSVAGTYYRYSYESIVPVVTPILILAIPVFDTASVLFIRVREGRPLFVGDRRHFSHRLVDAGLSVRAAVGTIHLLTLSIGLGAAMLLAPEAVRGILTAVQAALILTVVALLETAGRRKA